MVEARRCSECGANVPGGCSSPRRLLARKTPLTLPGGPPEPAPRHAAPPPTPAELAPDLAAQGSPGLTAAMPAHLRGPRPPSCFALVLGLLRFTSPSAKTAPRPPSCFALVLGCHHAVEWHDIKPQRTAAVCLRILRLPHARLPIFDSGPSNFEHPRASRILAASARHLAEPV